MCFSLKLSDATPGGTLQFLNVSKTFIFAYKVANFSDTNLSMNIDFSLDFGEEVEDGVAGPYGGPFIALLEANESSSQKLL